jgi:hypothetical protein
LKGSLVALRFHWNYKKLQQINHNNVLPDKKKVALLLGEEEQEQLIEEVKELFSTVPHEKENETSKKKKGKEVEKPGIEKKERAIQNDSESEKKPTTRPLTAIKQKKNKADEKSGKKKEMDEETEEEEDDVDDEEDLDELRIIPDQSIPSEGQKTVKDPSELSPEKRFSIQQSSNFLNQGLKKAMEDMGLAEPAKNKVEIRKKEKDSSELSPEKRLSMLQSTNFLNEGLKKAMDDLKLAEPTKSKVNKTVEEDDYELNDTAGGDEELPDYQEMTTVTIAGKKKKAKASKKKSLFSEGRITNNNSEETLSFQNNEFKGFLTEERKRFNQTMKQLQKMIEVHSKTITHLQEKSSTIEKENVKQRKDFMSLFSNQSQNQGELIQSLMQDRHLATNSVEKLVNLFSENQVNMLQLQQQHQMMQSTGAGGMMMMNPNMLATMMMMNQQQPQQQYLQQQNNLQPQQQQKQQQQQQLMNRTTDSDLDSVDPVLEEALRRSLDGTTSPSKQQQILQQLHRNQSPPEQQQMMHERPSTANKPLSLTNDSPLTMAKETLHNNNEQKNSNELQEIIEGTYKNDFKLWKQFFAAYKLPTEKMKSQSICNYLKDTRQLLLQVSMKWLKLGKKMLSDYNHPSKSNGK